MSLLLAFQQTVTSQQAQIDALKVTLTRILSLPGIWQRLGRPQPPQRQIER